ncbi:MAG: methyl-accepting chemotaxis protein, partial [Oscillospiraceae bacterium]
IKKISTKILLPTLVVLVSALIVSGVISAFLSYTSTINTLDQTMTETITVASARVTAELNNYKTLLTELSGVVKAVPPENVIGILNDATKRHGFENISITTPEGKIGGTDIDLSSFDFYKVPRETGNAFISDPIQNPDSGKLCIFVAVPVLTNGRFDGIIFTTVDAKKLSDIAASINIGETGNAAIIDKAGTTIAFYDYATVEAKYNTNEEAKKDPALENLAALEREVMAGNSGFGEYSYGGESKLMAYAPIEGSNGWGMYVTVAKNEFMQNTYMGILIVSIVIVVFMLLAVFILRILAKSISKPIIEVEQAAAEMAKGNFDVEIEHTAADETGHLANSMRQMIATTKSVIADTSRGLGEMAEGNFDLHPQAEYIGIFKDMENSIFKIIISLSDTISQIKVSSDQVSSGSDQVSSGAQALAQGATEQASSVEELSASINEVSQQINLNATNAANANRTAGIVGSHINTSNEQMTQMMAAMKEISASSIEIGKIIKTIEDIAFQTNILALNAAVEAARAGAAGKGFAVVADEVRNLATKSSEAAKQTNALIEGSVKAVENGVNIATATSQSLSEVVTGAEEITALIEQISTASSEQSTSIAQINLGVEQISSVVQTNSATAEESAAASEELSGQAQILNTLVSKFIVKNTGNNTNEFVGSAPKKSTAVKNDFDEFSSGKY